MHDALTNRPQVSYDPPTEQQRLEILRQAKQFLDGQVNEIEVSYLIIIHLFRALTRSGLSDIDHRNRREQMLSTDNVNDRKRTSSECKSGRSLHHI